MVFRQKERAVSAYPLPESTTRSLPSFMRIPIEIKGNKRAVCPKSDTGGEVNFHAWYVATSSSESRSFFDFATSIKSGQEAFNPGIYNAGLRINRPRALNTGDSFGDMAVSGMFNLMDNRKYRKALEMQEEVKVCLRMLSEYFAVVQATGNPNLPKESFSSLIKC